MRFEPARSNLNPSECKIKLYQRQRLVRQHHDEIAYDGIITQTIIDICCTIVVPFRSVVVKYSTISLERLLQKRHLHTAKSPASLTSL